MPNDHPFWAAVEAHRSSTTAATPIGSSSTAAEPSTFTALTTTSSRPPASAPEADVESLIGKFFAARGALFKTALIYI